MARRATSGEALVVSSERSRCRPSSVSDSPHSPEGTHDGLDHLVNLIEAGQLAPTIERTYAMHEMPAAMRHLQTGQARGKLAITINS